MKLATVITLVIFFAPVIPVQYFRGSVLPWVGCDGSAISGTPPPTVFVLASMPFYVTRVFGGGTWGFGLAVVPASYWPIQFAPIGYPNTVNCA